MFRSPFLSSCSGPHRLYRASPLSTRTHLCTLPYELGVSFSNPPFTSSFPMTRSTEDWEFVPFGALTHSPSASHVQYGRNDESGAKKGGGGSRSSIRRQALRLRQLLILLSPVPLIPPFRSFETARCSGDAPGNISRSVLDNFAQLKAVKGSQEGA